MAENTNTPKLTKAQQELLKRAQIFDAHYPGIPFKVSRRWGHSIDVKGAPSTANALVKAGIFSVETHTPLGTSAYSVYTLNPAYRKQQ